MEGYTSTQRKGMSKILPFSLNWNECMSFVTHWRYFFSYIGFGCLFEGYWLSDPTYGCWVRELLHQRSHANSYQRVPVSWWRDEKNCIEGTSELIVHTQTVQDDQLWMLSIDMECVYSFFSLKIKPKHHKPYTELKLLCFISCQVVKQCCGTDGVEANYIKTEILPPFFKHFWQHRMALDRRNYRQVFNLENDSKTEFMLGC